MPFNPPSLSPAAAPDTDPSAKESAPAQKSKKGRTPANELPRITASPESFEPPGAATLAANPFADRAAAGQSGWVSVPNAMVRQDSGDEPKRPAAAGAGGRGIAQTGAARVDTDERVESIPHVVARGENFFSIAQQYYGSGRFYPALWKANSDQVPAPEKLVVGQTIRIPPPEALDRSLILPPRTAQGPGSETAGATRPARTSTRSSVVALAVPVADPFDDRDRKAGKPTAGEIVAAPSAAERPRLPRYKIRPQETLRSIARDVLGDSRRADEILELNRAVIDDPGQLVPGQEIELPEDARLTRRTR
jgi:nucleoid-associated protein YgaU